MPRTLCSKRPDLDNLSKAVLDAMNGIVYVDDGLVCVKLARKWYAAGDEPAHLEIIVKKLEQEDGKERALEYGAGC